MDIIDTLAKRTHSPRGKFAATDQTYQELLHRIPEEQRPVVTHPKPRGFFVRWSAAACTLLIVGIGLAIAGVVYQQFYSSPAATDPNIASSETSDMAEIRTLIYEDTPLSVITSELEEIYHISIEVTDEKLMDYRLTATFSSDESIEEILSILAEAGGFEIQNTTDGFVIK